MTATRTEYERERGAVAGSGHLLQLLIGDPFFAWMRPLSQLMAALDERLDADDPIDAVTGGDFRKRTEALLNGSGPGGETFSPRYLAMLQEHPDLGVEHGSLRQALLALPGAETPPPPGR
jgi:hypothetical protein